MTKVAVYRRISRMTEESTSMSRQEQACISAAEAKFGEVEVETFSDPGISGYQDVERPAFDEMVARADEWDAIVVYRIDRLTRRGARHLLALIEDELEPAGCALMSATEPLDTSGPFAEILLTLLAVLAKMESQRLSDRMTATKRWLRRHGYWAAASPPFGYESVPTEDGNRTLQPVPEDAQVVREAAGRVLEGDTVTALVEDYREASGLTTRASWRKLLCNPVLAGYATHDGEIVFDGEDPVQPWEPVLDPSTHRDLCELFERRSGRNMDRSGTLLAGIIECGVCGYGMAGNTTRGYRSYRCNACNAADDRSSNQVSMSKTDAIVLGFCASQVPELLQRAAEADPDDEPGEELQRLEAVQEHLEGQLDKLLFEEGRDPDSDAVARTEERIERARRRRDELLAEREQKTAPRGAALSGMFSTEDVASELRGFDQPRQRRVVELVVSSVTVGPADGPGGRFDPERVHVEGRTSGQ